MGRSLPWLFTGKVRVNRRPFAGSPSIVCASKGSLETWGRAAGSSLAVGGGADSARVRSSPGGREPNRALTSPPPTDAEPPPDPEPLPDAGARADAVVGNFTR